MTTVLNKKQTYKDIFDGRSYQKVDGALFKNLDQGIKNELLEDYPKLKDDDFIAYVHLTKYSLRYMGKIIVRAQEKNESIKGYVTALSQEKDNINVDEQLQAKITFGQKIADAVAKFGGSWTFIISFILLMAAWMLINQLRLFGLHFDVYPFILLNLALSTLAAVQAPLIMMSQNRAAEYDRLQALNDFNVNKKSEEEIRFLYAKLDHIVQQDQSELLEIQKLQTEMLAAISRQLTRLESMQNQMEGVKEENE